MHRAVLAVAAWAVVAVLATPTGAMSVWPKPQQQTFGQTTHTINPETFDIAATGAASNILNDAIRRYTSIICGKEPTPAPAPATITGVDVDVTSSSLDLDIDTDESYSLDVEAPRIKLQAKTVFGALRGLETLSQLVEGVQVNETSVTDAPRFKFRAQMIDTSRHFYPVVVILQHIDAMAYAKMNVLHWHVVDSVSFPYESSTFPQMSREGAYTQTHVYTQDDIKTVVDYAFQRGIRVIPEFDSPGHVLRGFEAIPNLLTPCYNSSGPDGTTGPMNPTLNSTYDFLRKFYAEIKEVFPDKFVHVGGDEVSFDCWNSNPNVVQWMKEHNIANGSELEQYYEIQLLEILKEQNTSYICWEEIFDNGVKILPDTVVDVWKGGWNVTLSRVVKAGYQAVLSAAFYLNYISYGEDWSKYYTVEPTDIDATDEQKKLVVGIETCMWSEFVDATNAISRLWPRTAAVAERAWSAKDVTDVNDARGRLHEFRCKLIRRGINAEPIASGGGYNGAYSYCTEEFVPVYQPPF